MRASGLTSAPTRFSAPATSTPIALRPARPCAAAVRIAPDHLRLRRADGPYPALMRITVVGAGHVGRTLVEALHEEHELVVIDVDAARLAALADAYDVRTIQGDATKREVLRRAGIKRCDLMIACCSREEANLVSAIMVKQMSGAKTVARTTSMEL